MKGNKKKQDSNIIHRDQLTEIAQRPKIKLNQFVNKKKIDLLKEKFSGIEKYSNCQNWYEKDLHKMHDTLNSNLDFKLGSYVYNAKAKLGDADKFTLSSSHENNCKNYVDCRSILYYITQSLSKILK